MKSVYQSILFGCLYFVGMLVGADVLPDIVGLAVYAAVIVVMD